MFEIFVENSLVDSGLMDRARNKNSIPFVFQEDRVKYVISSKQEKHTILIRRNDYLSATASFIEYQR